jgi:hypothetical protein
MSAQLRARAKAFLERPIPQGMPYVPDSISERFLVAYATDGKLDVDPEMLDLLEICILEGHNAADTKSGDEADFFRESAEILEAIQAEMQ